MATMIVAKPAAAPTAAPSLSSPKPAQTPAPAEPPEPSSTTSRNLLVVLHGKRVEDELLRRALLDLKQQGHQVSVRVTFDRGDVEHFIDEAIRLNEAGSTKYQTIVAGGGDGTLNEVVAALMQHREAAARQGLSVALLPLGTANDFACTAGISVDPQEALRLALDPSTIRHIDVATVNGRHFLNVAVAGGLAEVPADELSSKWKRLLGPVAIAWHVLKRLSSKRVLQPHAGVSISFDPQPAATSHTQHTAAAKGQQTSTTELANGPQQQQQQQQQYAFQTDLLMLVAGNSRQMGRTLAVCPDALLDDGLLDFTLLSGSSLATQAAALLSALASRDDEDSAHDSGICQLRASRLEVVVGGTSSSSSSSGVDGGSSGASDNEGSSADVIPVNRDGEPEAASSRLVFEVLHKALPMHLPDDRLLVSGQAARSRAPQASIKGSIKPTGSERFVPAATAATSSASTATPAAVGQSGGKRGIRRSSSSRRHHQKRLTVRTLRRMLVVAGPEGQAVRRAARLAGLGRKLGVSLAVVLVGGVLGWLVGSRSAAAADRGGETQAAAAGSPGRRQRQRSSSRQHVPRAALAGTV